MPATEIGASATYATLNTGGWLNLTGQGLTPCKAHQASLGALTLLFSGAVFASAGIAWLGLVVFVQLASIPKLCQL